MDQREFEAVVDELAADAKDLLDLVEQARYEQSTAVAISRLLDAREDLHDLIAKVPALRATAAPADMRLGLASLRAHIGEARDGLKSSNDSKPILQLVTQLGESFASLVAPLQADGRWPRARSR
jgi:hypothetical protein